mmetsp:Transcript_14889/g.42243  ORF Transcript_14889/g.42243 Transcript_14889/m.42243 type:complete len:256 (-) Transcript_14889:1315-2082(-)
MLVVGIHHAVLGPQRAILGIEHGRELAQYLLPIPKGLEARTSFVRADILHREPVAVDDSAGHGDADGRALAREAFAETEATVDLQVLALDEDKFTGAHLVDRITVRVVESDDVRVPEEAANALRHAPENLCGELAVPGRAFGCDDVPLAIAFARVEHDALAVHRVQAEFSANFHIHAFHGQIATLALRARQRDGLRTLAVTVQVALHHGARSAGGKHRLSRRWPRCRLHGRLHCCRLRPRRQSGGLHRMWSTRAM